MSDIPKPWFMFNKENNGDDNSDEGLIESTIDKMIDSIQAQIDSLTDDDDGDDDYESDCNDEWDSVEGTSSKEDSTVCEKIEVDKLFEYINEKLSVFPECAGLLWTAVNLAVKKHRPIMADEYFKRLIAIPIKKHGFDTIVSEIKYLMCDPFGSAPQIKKYVRYLQKKYPSREEGIYYEGILEERLGNCNKSIELFKHAVDVCKRAPRSAEHLTNIMLDAGEYEEVFKYAKLADMMSTSKKRIVNMSDLSFDLCLAKDALLKQRDLDGETITTDEIDTLRRSYEKLRLDYSELKSSPILQERIDILNAMRNELEK